jgi:hypothetical protein
VPPAIAGPGFVRALENDHRTGGGCGRPLFQAVAIEQRRLLTKYMLAQQARDGLDEVGPGHLDDGDHIGVQQMSESVARVLECPTDQNCGRGVVRMQHLECMVVIFVTALIVELERELIGAGTVLVRQNGPWTPQVAGRSQGVDQHVGNRPCGGSQHAKFAHAGSPEVICMTTVPVWWLRAIFAKFTEFWWSRL